jgi:acetylornithine deacetylase/succinyl-diaminopimelate desuccinylase-like protein
VTQAQDNRTPNLAAVFATIDARRQAYLDRLIAYVRQPSISAHSVGMSETAALIAAEMERLGLHPRLLPTDGWPMVVGRRARTPDAPTVLLYGHYDVQPPEPLDAWTTPPFEPTVRHNRLYGRGVADNKGQHLAHLLAIEALLAHAAELPCNVILLLEGEEEMGSPHIGAFLREHRANLQADLAVVADGPVHVSGRSWIVCGARGIVSFKLQARGAQTDLHSGAWGGIAPNPIWQLVHLLGTMKNAQGDITIDGIYDHIRPATEAEQAALAALPIDPDAIRRDLGIAAFDAPAERPLAERQALWPTLTINGLHGGYAGPGMKTVLPNEAYALCDMRLVADQAVADIRAKVAAHVARHAPDVELTWLGAMEPSRTPLDSPYTAPLRAALRDVEGSDPLLMPTLGGSLPTYLFTGELGLPTFVLPYGNADQQNHGPDENLELERFFNGIKTTAALLTHLGALRR